VIECIEKWAVINKCELNIDKTKVLEIKKQKINNHNGEKIGKFEIVNTYKYLGIIIDSSLTMREYFSNLKNKINKISRHTFKFQL
jgi:hypothetical protein